MADVSLLPEEKPTPEQKADNVEQPKPEAAPEVEVAEKAPEAMEEALDKGIEYVKEEEKAVEAAPADEAGPPPALLEPIAQAAPLKDRLTKEIETVLEEDITDLFLKLPQDKQKEFQEKGEETAGKIRKIVAKTKINAKKIFSLIRDWLKVIPGVNRFFLEQEAKIKTDKIILITEDDKRRGIDEVT